MQVSTIGIGLAKNVFQVHGADAQGKAVLVRQLRRRQVVEFFSELTQLGHTVRLIPPAYVKAYVKRSKNDAAAAAAICEAVTRPSMRFVPIKTADQQAALSVHRTRELLIRQRTQLINALRAHLAEIGLVADQGRNGLARLVALATDASNLQSLPIAMLRTVRVIIAQLAALQQQIADLDRCIQAQHRASDVGRRLESIPGIGPIGATAIAATITDPSAFKSGRDGAAWIGLVPRQNSTGGKARLGGISKQGDRYLRRLLVVGAMAVVRHAGRRPWEHPWIAKLLAKKPVKLVAIAVANKTARIAWAIMSRGGTYRAPALAAAV